MTNNYFAVILGTRPVDHTFFDDGDPFGANVAFADARMAQEAHAGSRVVVFRRPLRPGPWASLRVIGENPEMRKEGSRDGA